MATRALTLLPLEPELTSLLIRTQQNVAGGVLPAFPGWSEGPCCFHVGLKEPLAALEESDDLERSAVTAQRGPGPPRRERRGGAHLAPGSPYTRCWNLLGRQGRAVPAGPRPTLWVHEQNNKCCCFKPLNFGMICSAAWISFFLEQNGKPWPHT